MENSVKAVSIEKLFDEVINTRGIHHDLNLNENQIRSLRKRFNDEKGVSVEKMREILKKAGYKCIQEEKWGKILF